MLFRSVIAHLFSAGIFILPLQPAFAAVNTTGQLIDQAVDQLSQQKTALGNLYSLKNQFGEKEFKFFEKKLSGQGGLVAPTIKHTDTNNISISVDGKMVTVEVIDIEKGQFKIGRQRLDMAPAMPIAEKWKAVEARLKGALSTSWIPSLIPEAHADPLVGLTVATYYAVAFTWLVTNAKGCEKVGEVLEACNKMRASIVDDQVLGNGDLAKVKKIRSEFNKASSSYLQYALWCPTTKRDLQDCRKETLAKLDNLAKNNNKGASKATPDTNADEEDSSGASSAH